MMLNQFTLSGHDSSGKCLGILFKHGIPQSDYAAGAVACHIAKRCGKVLVSDERAQEDKAV